MKFKTNLAYNKTNLRQRPVTEKIHIGRIYRNRTRVRLKFYIFSIVAAAAFLSVFILSLVQCNEITASLNSIKKKIQLQTSENVRLKTQLEQKMSLQKVEKYVQENLNMKHLNNNQINFIKTPKISQIEKTKQDSNKKSENKFGLLDKFINNIKKIIKAES